MAQNENQSAAAVNSTPNSNANHCALCNTPNCTLRCSLCHITYYCNRTCQVEHWKSQHSKKCINNKKNKKKSKSKKCQSKSNSNSQIKTSNININNINCTSNLSNDNTSTTVTSSNNYNRNNTNNDNNRNTSTSNNDNDNSEEKVNTKTKININDIETNTINSYIYPDEVFTDADARKKYGNKHNTIDNGILNFAGKQIPMENYLSVFNKGAAYRAKFVELSVEKQANILLGNLSLDMINIDNNIREKEILEKYTGTNGEECDGCQLQYKEYLEDVWIGDPHDPNTIDKRPKEKEWLVKICKRCKYGVCENCEHDKQRGTCFCKDSNFNQDYNKDLDQRHWYQRGFW